MSVPKLTLNSSKTTQAVVTPICAILRAATEVTVQLPGHRGFSVRSQGHDGLVTGSQGHNGFVTGSQGHDGFVTGSRWFCHRVTMVLSQGHKVTMVCHRVTMVLSQGHDGFPKRSQAKIFTESGMQTYTLTM